MHSRITSRVTASQNTASAPETHKTAAEISVTSPLGSVQTARLVQHLSDTELHVGIAAGEFGKIDIHTSVSESQISARIYVEHDDLKAALVGSLPQFHEKLSAEHRLDAQIELYNTGPNFSNGSDRQQQQQRTPEQHRPASLDTEFLTPPAGARPGPSEHGNDHGAGYARLTPRLCRRSDLERL